MVGKRKCTFALCVYEVSLELIEHWLELPWRGIQYLLPTMIEPGRGLPKKRHRPVS